MSALNVLWEGWPSNYGNELRFWTNKQLDLIHMGIQLTSVWWALCWSGLWQSMIRGPKIPPCISNYYLWTWKNGKQNRTPHRKLEFHTQNPDGQKQNHCYKISVCLFLLYIDLKAMASGKNDDGSPSVFTPKPCVCFQK